MRFKRNVRQMPASKSCVGKPHSRGILRAAGFSAPVSMPSTSAADAGSNPSQPDASRTSYIGAVTQMGVKFRGVSITEAS